MPLVDPLEWPHMHQIDQMKKLREKGMSMIRQEANPIKIEHESLHACLTQNYFLPANFPPTIV